MWGDAHYRMLLSWSFALAIEALEHDRPGVYVHVNAGLTDSMPSLCRPTDTGARSFGMFTILNGFSRALVLS